MLNLTILSIVFSSLLIGINAADPCYLDLLNTNVLVIYDNQILFPEGDNKSTTIEYGDTFLLACAEGSTSPLLNEGGERVRCSGGTKLAFDRMGQSHYFTDIKCVQKLPGIAMASGSSCNDGGTLVNVGLSLSSKFAAVYTICFDEKRLITLSATFNVTFNQWGSFSNETTEHYFVDDGHLYEDLDVDLLYDQQRTAFNSLGIADYLTDEIYLIKGQLLPSYLFTLSQLSDSSFNYANSAPQWSVFRNVFSEYVYNFLTSNEMEPKAYEAGTSGVATIWDANEPKNIYLDYYSIKVPVPKWVWFTVEGSFTIYGYNNPYYNETKVEEEFKAICMLPYSFEKFKNMLVGVCAGDPNFDS